jgi:hypothetical protein
VPAPLPTGPRPGTPYRQVTGRLSFCPQHEAQWKGDLEMKAIETTRVAVAVVCVSVSAVFADQSAVLTLHFNPPIPVTIHSN